MTNPTDTTAAPKTTSRGPQWLTATELHSYIKDTYGVSLHRLVSPHPTFQSWAKKHNIRKREFKFDALTTKAQQAKVQRVEDGSLKLYQKPASILRRCKYEFNMSDVRKHVVPLVRKLQPAETAQP